MAFAVVFALLFGAIGSLVLIGTGYLMYSRQEIRPEIMKYCPPLNEFSIRVHVDRDNEMCVSVHSQLTLLSDSAWSGPRGSFSRFHHSNHLISQYRSKVWDQVRESFSGDLVSRKWTREFFIIQKPKSIIVKFNCQYDVCRLNLQWQKDVWNHITHKEAAKMRVKSQSHNLFVYNVSGPAFGHLMFNQVSWAAEGIILLRNFGIDYKSYFTSVLDIQLRSGRPDGVFWFKKLKNKL